MLAVLLVALAATPLLAATRTFVPVQAGPFGEAQEVELFAPDRVLVKFTRTAMQQSSLEISAEKGATSRTGVTGLATVDGILAQAGVRSIERPFIAAKRVGADEQFGRDRWFMIRTNPGDMKQLAKSLGSDPAVETATVDWRAFPAAVPSDPLHPDHWGHNNTAQLPGLDWGGTYEHTLSATVGTVGFDANAQAAWDASQGYGDAGVIIAIIDSGVDVGHPDLRQVTGYDFGDNDSNPDDDSSDPGHGTACAGVTAAMNNNLGSAGIAAGCSIMPLKVANNAGSMYFSAIVNAINYAADNGADIISMSLGAAISSDSATDAALQYAYNSGCTILAATGNENMSTISYPAINSYVIGVGAASPCGERKRSSSSSTDVNPGVDTDPNGYTCDGERWWGSNYGVTSKDAAGAVDIIAPTILPTTDIQGSGGYESGDYSGFFNGTSCATPYAAGVCALIKSANPTWAPAQIRDQLVNTAVDVTSVESGSGWDRYTGYGMIDAAAAVGGGGPVAPTANFVGSPTSGEYPLNVSFTDQSAGAPESWSWTFGDGGTSTAQNPSHTYTSAGSYTVTLTVSNSVGNDTMTRSSYIDVTEPPTYPPTAAFTGTPVSGTAPLDVNFSDQSTNAPVSWSWTFGDGATSTQQNPSHTYAAVGTYTVALTVSNMYGNDSITKTDYITVNEPGQTTLVTASGETAVTGSVNGTYAATAAADGAMQTITEVQYTGHPRKTYSYLEHRWSFNLPAGGDATFHLTAARTANSDGDNFAFEYTTDGATWLPLVTVASATQQAYTNALGPVSGAVTVRVTDTDRNWGNLSFDAVAVDYMAFEKGDVQPVAPTADFSGTPVSGEYPLVVQFSDLSAGDPTGWSWTFGDGGTSNVKNPSHTYAAAGVYTVAMTATNAQGSDSATKNGYITVTEPGQGGSAMHVNAMSVTRLKSGPNYSGRCTIVIVDDQGQPVSSATVSCSYDGITSGNTSGTTGSNGSVTLQTSGMKRPSGEWCFEVTSVTHATLTYDAAANVATRVCEGGTVYGADTALMSGPALTTAPNPFNPMTEIAFRIPADGHVRLTIYDMRGRVFETLVDGSMSAGLHQMSWNARGAAGGVYFARLEGPSVRETLKLILLK